MANEYYLPQVLTPIATETAEGRFERDYESMGTDIVPEGLLEDDPRYDGTKPYAGATDEESDDRKARQLDHQSSERQSRLYVERTTGVSATGKDHPVKDVLWEASNAESPSDPDYPSEAELDAAYAADASNDNLPEGM
jgi:hypothetical protein